MTTEDPWVTGDVGDFDAFAAARGPALQRFAYLTTGRAADAARGEEL